MSNESVNVAEKPSEQSVVMLAKKCPKEYPQIGDLRDIKEFVDLSAAKRLRPTRPLHTDENYTALSSRQRKAGLGINPGPNRIDQHRRCKT
jgi:hypothetical protein